MLRDKGNNETWEITWFVRWTICEAGGVGGGGGAVVVLRGWFVLGKIYTCTKLIFS